MRYKFESHESRKSEQNLIENIYYIISIYSTTNVKISTENAEYECWYIRYSYQRETVYIWNIEVTILRFFPYQSTLSKGEGKIEYFTVSLIVIRKKCLSLKNKAKQKTKKQKQKQKPILIWRKSFYPPLDGTTIWFHSVNTPG